MSGQEILAVSSEDVRYTHGHEVVKIERVVRSRVTGLVFMRHLHFELNLFGLMRYTSEDQLSC